MQFRSIVALVAASLCTQLAIADSTLRYRTSSMVNVLTIANSCSVAVANAAAIETAISRDSLLKASHQLHQQRLDALMQQLHRDQSTAVVVACTTHPQQIEITGGRSSSARLDQAIEGTGAHYVAAYSVARLAEPAALSQPSPSESSELPLASLIF